MIFHHVIFLLLCWTFVKAVENQPAPHDMIDQIAMASENLGFAVKHSNMFSTTVKSTSNLTPTITTKAASIHYENSNGFIPMTSIDGSLLTASNNHRMNLTVNKEERSSLDDAAKKVTEDTKLIEEDPAYSTEARMFLNLPGPSADRRSFDGQDGQNEFEILKVTKETPAIANYQEFYENVQNNLRGNRGGTQGRYAVNEDPLDGRTTGQKQRTKDRIKKIEKYVTNYRSNQGDITEAYKQHNPFVSNVNSKPLITQKKAIFEAEKVQSNFHQNTGSYDNYPQSPTPRPRVSSTLRSNYDTTTKNRHINSKPVVVVEPGDYKLDLKYGPQQVVAKVSNTDSYRNQKPRKEPAETNAGNTYDARGPGINSEDRYGHSYERIEDTNDYSDEADDYLEVTEKPRRIHKQRRRPYNSENSKRLPKEHRGHSTDDLDLNDSRKHNLPSRAKLHRPKAKPSYWNDDERGTTSEISSEEQSNNDRPSTTSKPEEKHHKSQGTRGKGGNQWSQVGPNIEVSHSNGYQVNDNIKPNVLVPVNLNLVPLTNFDHSSALGNSQGFDFTNIPNYVTATPMVSTPSSLLSTSQSVISAHIANSANAVKNPVPDIIVGQNTYQNPVQTVFLPHMEVHQKFPSTLRAQYLPSTVAPMFTVTQTMNPNVHHINPTVSTRPQTLHHMTSNPVSPMSPLQSQLLLPQSTLQSFPLLQTPFQSSSNYNILVNPNGLHGQNTVQQGHIQGSTTPSSQPSSSTPRANSITNDNLHTSESQVRKTTASNGQFLASASLSVGSGEQQNHDNSVANNNNNNYYNSNNNNNNNNQATARTHQNENYYQIYKDDDNNNQRIKTYIQTAHVLPGIIHSTQNIPVNYNNQNFANQLQAQQSVLSPTIVQAQRPRDGNQQILKAANDIFENTWKQLKQLQINDEAKNLANQHIYRVNDNLESTSNINANTINALQSVSSAKAHLPYLATQNVEIVNPNIRPSPVDFTMINPYPMLHHYPTAVVTTPIPIFSTTTSFLTPRPGGVGSTTGQSIDLQRYVDSLTQMGSHSNQVNKLEIPPVIRNQDYQRPLYNPINFVPNADLMNSQSMLNSKIVEPLPHQLNLVPLIPGGNFFKNTYGAQTELIQKPRLRSDLEKYAEEMFKESMKTIYSTHKWNNDRKQRGNYSVSELNDLMNLKNELQRFKASLTDSKQFGKDILEGHHSETKLRTSEPSRPTKNSELSIAALEQLFKSDFKHKSPSSESQKSHNKNRPSSSHGSSRPSIDNFNDFRNLIQLSDYLTPPKPNSFVSKSPFIDSPKSTKKRPGSSSRYNSIKNKNNNGRALPRPSSLSSRPGSGPEASASNHQESSIQYQHRHGKHSRDNDHYTTDYYRDSNNHFDGSYPTFTTTAAPELDNFKASSQEQSSKSDYYDINHPRMHNLLGLLMKNKQLPNGSSQSFFRDEDELQQYFENEKRRLQLQYFDEAMKDFQKKSDVSLVNMGPPLETSEIHYYSGKKSTNLCLLIDLQRYVNLLGRMGAHSDEINKFWYRLLDYKLPFFDAINFVPNVDLMNSYSMLNSNIVEPLPHQLNLVPLIPGGNFFKNTYGAQTELIQKPRLRSDLEKYAEEMFKESMKTIYSTHKWNNDRKQRGNYSVSELNDLMNLKNELQRFKASLTDSKQFGKDILEGHHSETKLRTSEPSRPTKNSELSIAALEQLFKSDFKHKSPSSESQKSHNKNRPSSSHGSSRPSIDNFNDFRNLIQLSDYLTPPKPNSFVSKSPFIDSPKSTKKRPGSSSRYNSIKNKNNNGRALPRPSSLSSRPGSGPEASASNHQESSIQYQHRHGKHSRDNDHYTTDYYRDSNNHFDGSYPTFTTTAAPELDNFKASSQEQSSKSDYYDINHPRMHNLLGLLMKNKQLPNGSSQSFFRDEDELQQYFENEKRRLQLQYFDEAMKDFQKKSDVSLVNMGPPLETSEIHYYSGKKST